MLLDNYSILGLEYHYLRHVIQKLFQTRFSNTDSVITRAINSNIFSNKVQSD